MRNKDASQTAILMNQTHLVKNPSLARKSCVRARLSIPKTLIPAMMFADTPQRNQKPGSLGFVKAQKQSGKAKYNKARPPADRSHIAEGLPDKASALRPARTGVGGLHLHHDRGCGRPGRQRGCALRKIRGRTGGPDRMSSQAEAGNPRTPRMNPSRR